MVLSKADTAIDTNAKRRFDNATNRLLLCLGLALTVQTIPLAFASFDSNCSASCQVGAETAPALDTEEKGVTAKSDLPEAEPSVAEKAETLKEVIGEIKSESVDFSDSLIHENLTHKNGVTSNAPSFSQNINNFDVVSEGLWRGAAPSHQAMVKLAESGVKTIVDLRMAGQGAAEEKARASKLGIKYIHIPLGFKGPSLLKVAQFLNIVNNPANQPVFVHCRYGADRTGALVAVFRVIHDHWTFNQAYTEMRSHHFKPWLAGLKRMVARVGGNASVQKELKYLTENGQENREKQVASKVINRS
jgi:protein tyrosine phosphatase (PTP) superfamily phosphohydrolase (DUF442 family)